MGDKSPKDKEKKKVKKTDKKVKAQKKVSIDHFFYFTQSSCRTVINDKKQYSLNIA